MQSEFRMITDIAEVAPKELAFNYDELKAFLTDALMEYKTLVVTEDTISDAKAKKAKLNKLSDNISAYRISVKKQLMAKYDEDFKPKCDELCEMIKEASENISTQVKAFENAVAQAKIDELHEFYDKCDAGAKEGAHDFCPWDAIYSDKWKNKGVSIEQAKEEIISALLKTGEDIATIRTMDSQDVPALLLEYKRTRDLAAVVRMSTSLKQAHEEQKRREAEEVERRRNEQIEEALHKNEEAARESAAEYVLSQEPESAEPTDFRVWATQRQLMSLKGFLRANGIRYGRVE